MNITINEWLEDFDNDSLTHEEWIEALENAMHDYNEKFGTTYTFKPTYNAYLEYKRKKYI